MSQAVTNISSGQVPASALTNGAAMAAMEAPAPHTVATLVTAAAERFPELIAVRSRTRSITYAELDRRANQLAHRLLSAGLIAGKVVGIRMERSIEMVVAALAAWRAGCAYLPIDTNLPRERVEFMLQEVAAPVVLIREDFAQCNPPTRAVRVDLAELATSSESSAEPQIHATPDDLAYVIYTSGSTGRPKGVQITHANLLNLVSWHNRAFNVTSNDRASHLAGLGFDAAVWELWPYLVAGATVILAPEEVRNSADALEDWLVDEKITISFVPTPLTEILITSAWPSQTNLRVLLTGGDVLHRYPNEDLPFAVVNNYGPTECTVVSTSGKVAPANASASLPSIGVPIDNTSVYILDSELNELEDGEPGELCVAGANLGRGYVASSKEMQEHFVTTCLRNKLANIYRTGDLARRLPNGEIAFMGRLDDQIKIRGYRIEPAEIVRCLDSLPDIQASAVIAQPATDGEQRLIAYVVPRDNSALERTRLQESLLQSLPDYMVPAIFVRVDALPFNSSGKIDRSGLPTPDSSNIVNDEPVASSATVIQSRVKEIVAKLLGLEDVDIHENFFLIGGHSLLGTQLIARIRDTFGVDLKLRALFESPTVAGLAGEIENAILANIESDSNPPQQKGASGAL